MASFSPAATAAHTTRQPIVPTTPDGRVLTISAYERAIALEMRRFAADCRRILLEGDSLTTKHLMRLTRTGLSTRQAGRALSDDPEIVNINPEDANRARWAHHKCSHLARTRRTRDAPPQLTPEEDAHRRQLHAEGLDDAEMALVLNRSKSSVQQWRTRAKLPANGRRGPRPYSDANAGA